MEFEDRAEDRTRARVARSVLEHGPSTAAALAERLSLTPAAVRRHLDALVTEGVLESREPRLTASGRGRGRPARVFALTSAGRDRFHHAYDDLAVTALRYLAEVQGKDAVLDFARAQVAPLEARHSERLADVAPDSRARVLAEALSGDGYAASVSASPSGDGEQLCQHHCPVAHVAAQFPALCEAETEVLARLLGTHVQRLATIAHGDGICTTHVPRSSSTSRSSSTLRSSSTHARTHAEGQVS
ncbi:MAG: helix-turn-helix transcriptional regulator [Actinomycetes bacterium]